MQQRESALRLGVHPGGLENWEYGRSNPADRFIPRIIGFLRYNPLPAAKSVGQLVTLERAARGWSRKRLAAEAGIDEMTVKRIELDAPRLIDRSVRAVLAVLAVLDVGDFNRPGMI